MIKIVFRQEAVSDLISIRDYFSTFSAITAENIAQDIEASLYVLRTFPESGRKKSFQRREITTTKYRQIIEYLYKNDTIEITGIYRFQNR